MLSSKCVANIAGFLVIFFTFGLNDARSAEGEGVPATWTLQAGHDIPSQLTKRPFLEMDGQKISGSTGCNTFTAVLSERPDNHIAIEQVSTTRKLCGPVESNVESAVLRAMSGTEFIANDGKKLTFFSASRVSLLVWTRRKELALKPSLGTLARSL
jgi:heat shock protein HslJ